MPSKKKTSRNSFNNFLTNKKVVNIVDLFVIIILIIIIFLIINYNNKFGSSDGFHLGNNNNTNNNKSNKSNKSHENTLRIIVDQNNKESNKSFKDSKHYERIINPLLPPERSFEHTVGIPINVPTRGISSPSQQIGALYKERVDTYIDGEDDDPRRKIPGNNSDSVILPLYGNPTYPKSNKWSYHVATDKNNQVKMPLNNKGKKCDNKYGCEEIQNDDLITIPGYNGQFRAVIYDYDTPKYIPYV